MTRQPAMRFIDTATCVPSDILLDLSHNFRELVCELQAHVMDGDMDRAMRVHEELIRELAEMSGRLGDLHVALQLDRVLSYSLEGDGDV